MKNNVLKKLLEKAGVSPEKINRFSVQTGFIKRCRQIKAVEFLVYMIKAGADFISRYKHKTTLYDPQTGQEIDLCRLFDIQRTVDQKVWIGKDSKTEVRLTAVEVSQETAGRRRQKAIEDCRGIILEKRFYS